ncbi:MAG: hypothetical protein ACE5EL_06990 [Anaerolineae bacterium]
MNPDEVLRADAVDRAVAALLSGAHRGDILAVLPAGVGRLLDAAVALREARLDAGGPRPSFVLSLEDDLRTDLRLQVRSRSLARRGRRRALAGLAAAALLTGLMLTAGQAVPGDRLYGLKRGVEGIRAPPCRRRRPRGAPNSPWAVAASVRLPFS